MTLVRAGFIPIPAGAKPGFDHADVYRARRRMYVAHTGADRVDVLNLEQRAFTHSLFDLPGVAGVLIYEPHDLLFTSDRSAAQVSVFRCSDEELLGRVQVGPHPNGLAYDPTRQRLYSFNLGEPLGENCSTTVVDIDAMAAVAELALPGRPRWATYDADRNVVYANIREPAELVVIDCERTAIDHEHAVPAAGPHGLWLDQGRLFCAADGGELVVIDRNSGALLERLPLQGAPDVIMLDPDLQRLYVAIGEPGAVCVFTANPLAHVETIETEAGAHTCGWDPDARCLYVFCPESGGAMLFEERG